MQFTLKMAVLVSSLTFAAQFGLAQPFTLDGSITNLPGVVYGTVAWADCDNDNDLDLIVAGQLVSFTNITRIYGNNGGLFTQLTSNLAGVQNAEAKWSDFDNDGDLDPLVAGDPISRLYRNNFATGTFTNATMALPTAYIGHLDWGDYDNDGDNDLAISGYANTSGSPFASIYRNDAGVLVADTSHQFDVVSVGEFDWADYDADGDLDLSVMGSDTGSSAASFHLFQNNGGQFLDIPTAVKPMLYSNVEWADYDSDGDLDLLTNGDTTSWATIVYQNVAGTLNPLGGTPIFPAEIGNVSWMDDDNDGDLDILITSLNGSRIARNNFGIFANITSGLPTSMAYVAQDIGDYDGDADVDVLVSYVYGNNQRLTSIYRNGTQNSNSAPDAPQNLQATVSNPQEIQFSWDAALDAQTPSSGLSYRLCIGTSPTAYDFLAPVADTGTGYLRLPDPGPIKGLTWTLHVPYATQTYYACVQAIDGGLMGSPCSNQVSAMVVALESARTVVVTAGPNPTKGHVKVQATDTPIGGITYQLQDLQGRVMGQIEGEFNGSMNLDLSGLPAATYMLQLSSSTWPQPETIKLVRQ